MKTIGLIGGMSWESSIEYYRIINEETKRRLGGLHNSVSLMYTVDFDEVEKLQRANQWDEAGRIMVEAAKKLEMGGADFIVICTNTMHKSVPQIINSVKLPVLHIADATASRITSAGLTKIALLGTRYTMEEDFYKGRLSSLFGLEVLIPDHQERDDVHDIIYKELVLGSILPASRARYLQIIEHLIKRGAQGVILGCTEIGLLVKANDCSIPIFDTTRIHAEEAVNMALSD